MKENQPPRKRLRTLTGILLGLTITFAIFGGQIRQFIMVQTLLRSPAPNALATEEVFMNATRPGPLLRRFWETGGVVHRTRVLNYIKARQAGEQAWSNEVNGLILEGAFDEDLSLRELALGMLKQRSLPDFANAAKSQLTEPDPEARLLGLKFLPRPVGKECMPMLLGLLDDSDLQVASATAVMLQLMTGEDFGVRRAQTLFRIEVDGSRTHDPARLAEFQAGVSKLRNWAGEHWLIDGDARIDKGWESNNRHLTAGPPRAVADFTLSDLDDREVKLSTFRGRWVVLNFWTTWCPACIAEFPALSELQRRHPGQLSVLGVSLDEAPEEHDHHHGEEHDTAQTATSSSPTKMKAMLKKFKLERGMNYPVLLDTDGELSRRFNGHELPTTVIIDPAGNLHRRFVGGRSVDGFEALMGFKAAPAENR